MNIYAISDLHMSFSTNKPMDIFGTKWEGYLEKIKGDWLNKVKPCDTVLIAGDISWAMYLEEALLDINFLSDLPGNKILIRGNHDYWWKSISRIRASLPSGIFALQNDSVKIGNKIICGSRGWCVEGSPDFKETDRKIYLREVERFRLALNSAKKIAEDGDEIYCMVHYPPFNVKREDSLFTNLFESFNVKKVIYGHLHGKDSLADKYLIKNNIEYYLTSCDKLDNNLALIVNGD